ncbi:MAG: hypothetical protein V4635_17310 [Bacteroidota bacterium]
MLYTFVDTLNPPDTATESAAFWTWMGDDGICRTRAKTDAEISVDDAIANSAAVTSFFTGKKYPLMVDARNVRSIDKNARKHFSINGRETKITSFAIMVKSPLSRVIGNFFMGLNKPTVPARLFDDEALAIKWLKTFL